MNLADLDASAVAVAFIGLLGILSGHLVSRWGKRAEARQKELADRAAHEHKLFEERGAIMEDLRVQADRADFRAERMQQDAQEAWEEARRLRADLAALAAVVKDEVAKEAARTAAQIEAEENQGGARRIRPED